MDIISMVPCRNILHDEMFTAEVVESACAINFSLLLSLYVFISPHFIRLAGFLCVGLCTSMYVYTYIEGSEVT